MRERESAASLHNALAGCVLTARDAQIMSRPVQCEFAKLVSVTGHKLPEYYTLPTRLNS